MNAVSILIIIANLIVSWKGFNDRQFYERYSFNVEKVLVHRQFFRIITSSFLHVSWGHLIWNMISLYLFSETVEMYLGPWHFLLIYFTSIIAGDVFTLLVHRNHSDFSTVGASAGVSGIIFAAIAIFPGMKIGFILLPLFIPAWVYGLVFVLVSIYGIRSRNNNVGHEAHLAGALAGMLTGIALYPAAMTENLLPILVVTVPALVFIYIILKRPHTLLIDNNFFKSHQRYYSIDHRYNAEKMSMQQEVDRILDKISRKGMKSLSPKEKEILRRHSKTLR